MQATSQPAASAARARKALYAACIVASVLAESAPAEEPPLGMILPGEKLEVLLSAAGDTRTLGVPGVEDARLSVSVKAVRRSKARPELTVIAPDGAVFDAGDAYSVRGSRAAYTKVRLPSTGRWRVGIRSPAGASGVIAIAARVKCPSKYVLPGETTGDAPASDVTFPAIPHSTVKVGVRALGRETWTPSVELISPSGRSLGTVAGKGAKATLAKIEIAELGDHRVRVTGGQGEFAVTVAVKPPRPRVVTWRDVEAVPEIRAFRPGTTTNDTDVDVFLDGVGFSGTDAVVLSRPGVNPRVKGLDDARSDSAFARIPLDDLAPGEYEVLLATSSGASVTAPGTMRVTNREPAVISVFPPESPCLSTVPMVLAGAGFDLGSTVEAFAADGSPVPVVFGTRTNHRAVTADLVPGPYDTGVHRIAGRDPTGALGAVQGTIDLLGFTREPSSIRSVDPWGTNYSVPRDAAWNARDGTVLVAIQGMTSSLTLVLFDPADMSVLDTLSVVAGGSTRPHVAWNPVDGTWGLAWRAGTGSGTTAHFRILDSHDLDSTLADVQLGTADVIYQVDVTCRATTGDWLLAWDSHTADGAGDLMSAVVRPDGTRDTPAHVLATNANGYIWYPVATEAADDGRYVVVYLGEHADRWYAVRRVVVGEDGATASSSVEIAFDVEWLLSEPKVARNPQDGSVLVGFAYDNLAVFHPAFVRLDGPWALPGDVVTMDDDGIQPWGYLESLVWNPARGEFVAAVDLVLDYDWTYVGVRRIRPDGRIKPLYTPLVYEGWYGTLWSGPDPGQLGLVRAFDGFTDGLNQRWRTNNIHGAPLR